MGGRAQVRPSRVALRLGLAFLKRYLWGFYEEDLWVGGGGCSCDARHWFIARR